jgi:hypothetical protein
MMTLTPRMHAVLAEKIAEYYAMRPWSRLTHAENAIGHALVDASETGRSDPACGRWVVLTFANHERLHVIMGGD